MNDGLTDDDSEEREPESQPISLLELVRIESCTAEFSNNHDEAPITVIELTAVKEMTVEELMSEFAERSMVNHAKHASTIEVIDQLALVLYQSHRYGEAEQYLKLQLSSSKLVNGPADKRTLAITGLLINSLLMISKYRESSLLLRSWIAANTKTYGIDHVETLAAKRYHAVCLGKLGKDIEAATVFKEILNSLDRTQEQDLHHQYRASKSLSDILMKMDSFGEAEGVFESILNMGKSLFDPNCLENLTDGRTLASIKHRLGKLDAAEGLYSWVLKGFEVIHGASHPETLTVLVTTADLTLQIYHQNVTRASPNSVPKGESDLRAVTGLYRRVINILEEKHGEKCLETFLPTVKMAEVWGLLKNYGDSEKAYKKALSISESFHGLKHTDSISTMNALANVLLKCLNGDYSEDKKEMVQFISELLLKVINGYKRLLGPVHTLTIESIRTLSSIHTALGLYHEALELLERALNACVRSLGRDDPRSVQVAFETATMQLKIGDNVAAEELFRRVVTWRRSNLGTKHVDTLRALSELGSVYTARRKYGEARTLYQEVLSECEKTFGEKHVETRNIMKLYVKLLLKVPEILLAVAMIHLSVQRTVAACGSLDLETMEITDLYVAQLADLEQFVDADAIYMKLYNSCVSEFGHNDGNTANLALKIGNFHFDVTKNYTLSVSMFQRAVVSFTESLGDHHQDTLDARIRLEKALDNQKQKLKK